MTDGSNPYAPPAGGPQDTNHNPYAPPSARIGTAGGDLGEAEEIRNRYLKHEASVRSVGCLYLWSGILALGITAFAVLALPLLFMASSESSDESATEMIGLYVTIFAIYGFFGGVNYWIGKGLRKLDPKVRTVATIFLVIGLLGFPFATIISLYFLYLLHSEKGKRVMTTEYQRIVEQTPHIQYRTSWIAWLVLALFIVAFIAMIFVAAGV